MSTLSINKYSDSRIKRILEKKIEVLDNNVEKEAAEGFIKYPRLDFENAEIIAKILDVDPKELFEKKEVSATTLNYRNKRNDLLKLFGEIDKQYKYNGEINGKQ